MYAPQSDSSLSLGKYKKNLLIQNAINVNGRIVSLENIDGPLLSVVAESDDLVSPTSTLAMKDHVSSKDNGSITFPGGHVGLSLSKMAHEKLWPEFVLRIIPLYLCSMSISPI